MQALRRRASRGTHGNVLQHLSGYLRDVLGQGDRNELQQLIGQYQQGIVPLVVPLTCSSITCATTPTLTCCNRLTCNHTPRPGPAQCSLKSCCR